MASDGEATADVEPTETVSAGTDGSTRHDGPPDGPGGLPFLGSVREFARDPLAFVTRVGREYGPVSRYELGVYEIHQLNDPALVEHVLVHHNENYVKGDVFQTALRPIVGEGLLTSEGETWREQRHRIQPAFTPERINAAAGVMTDYAERLTDEWTDGERRNVHDDMMQVTVEIVAQALFDVDIRERRGDLGGALEAVMDHAQRQMGRPVQLPLWLPTPGNRRYKRALSTIDAVADDIVDREADRERDAGRTDVVDMLMGDDSDAGAGVDRQQARDQIATLLLAGHETTALSLTYALHALGRNPDVAATLHAELDAVCGDAPPTLADLPELTYTEQVVKETMRLYPPVWEILREPVAPDVVGGYEIPKGATVAMHQWVHHRDPDVWDDPLAFRPERWTDERERSLPAYAYFPFGGGPRRCIGDRFAMLEARLVLATIAREWTTSPVADLSFAPSITLRPDGPVEMVVERR